MKRALVFCLFAGVTIMSADAVILFRTGDPSENTTAPTGDLANSGWQHTGFWSSGLAVPFAPRYFASSGHIGEPLEMQIGGATFHVIAVYPDPASDLKVLKVAEEFAVFAPLYSRGDEVGQRIAAFGRGTQRGEAILLNNTLHGWHWGADDLVKRWGENVVHSTVPWTDNADLLRALFDANGLPNECHLSAHDSGGAVFVNDNGTWKLAGINFAVDGVYTQPNDSSRITAAIFDARGFYERSGGSFTLITGDAPVPTGFYATRISRRLPWLASLIAEPLFVVDAALASLTHTRFVVPPSDLLYTVETTTDLHGWMPTAATDEVIATNASVRTVKSSVATEGAPRLFLRLRFSRP